jgi:hypothetical protein
MAKGPMPQLWRLIQIKRERAQLGILHGRKFDLYGSVVPMGRQKFKF